MSNEEAVNVTEDHLDGLLEAARAASPNDRIDFRDLIAAHGAPALQAMLEWARDPALARFAIRVVGRVGQTGLSDEASGALRQLRTGVPAELLSDVDNEAAKLERQPTGPLQRPRPVTVAGVQPDVSDFGWVNALQPVAPHYTAPIRGGATVTIVPLSFPLWVGPRLTMAEDCNKRNGRVRGDLGELSCGEVEVVKRVRRAGWSAYWVSDWPCGERLWGAYRARKDALPAWVQVREGEIRRFLPHELRTKKGGRPDVVAWAADRLVFVESKGPGDDTVKQEHWLSAAAAAGLTDRDLGVVQWFAEP